MAKVRKTKRQKKLSDIRHSQTPPAVNTENLYSLDLSAKSVAPKTESIPQIPSRDYSYLKLDMRRTTIVTGMIVLFELGIYWISVGY